MLNKKIKPIYLVSLLCISLSGTLMAATSHAAIAIIVNPGVDIADISKVDAANLFLKRSKALPGGFKFTPIDLKRPKELKQEFYLKVTGKNPNQLNAYWSRLMFTGKKHPPQTVNSQDDVKKAVRKNKKYIGYIDADEVDDTVKVLFRSK